MKTSEFEDLIGFIFFVLFIVGIILGICADHKTEKELGPVTYEITVVDKYDMVGSSFHLIGGRASETEFHLVYNYKCINRPNTHGGRIDRSVSHTTYTKYNIGSKFKSRTSLIS